MKIKAFQGSAIALAVVAVLTAACAEEETTTVPTNDNISAEDVAENIPALIGRTVTVRSEVVEAIGENTFTISDDDFFGTETILVLNATGAPFVLPEEDADVQVTGKVAQFVAADINEQYGLDLNQELYEEYENQPAIIARSLALAPELDEIADEPNPYYGRIVAVEGSIEEIFGANSFALGDDGLGEQLLVLNATPQQNYSDDQEVVVTGELRRFIRSDIEKEYGFNWDEEEIAELEVEYSQQPVLVATETYPSLED